MLSEWLERSGALPLVLWVAFSGSQEEDYNVAIRDVLTPMLYHANRWKLLHIIIQMEHFQWLSTQLLEHDMTCLDHIKYFTTCDERLDDLRIFRLNASPLTVTHGFGEHSIQARWDRLIHYEASPYRDTPFNECVDIFSNASQLSWCSISNVIDVKPATAFIACPSLTKLSVGDVPSSFWDHFTFPQLNDLSVYLTDTPDSWPGFQNLLQRSECMLKRLSVSQSRSQIDLVEVIKHLPLLEHLMVSGGCLDESFFSLMNESIASQTTSSPGILRHLKSLSITFTSHCNWTNLLAILTTIKSRPNPTLRCFYVEYSLNTKPEDFDRTISASDVKILLAVTKDLDFTMVNYHGHDIFGGILTHRGMVGCDKAGIDET